MTWGRIWQKWFSYSFLTYIHFLFCISSLFFFFHFFSLIFRLGLFSEIFIIFNLFLLFRFLISLFHHARSYAWIIVSSNYSLFFIQWFESTNEHGFLSWLSNQSRSFSFFSFCIIVLLHDGEDLSSIEGSHCSISFANDAHQLLLELADVELDSVDLSRLLEEVEQFQHVWTECSSGGDADTYAFEMIDTFKFCIFFCFLLLSRNCNLNWIFRSGCLSIFIFYN